MKKKEFILNAQVKKSLVSGLKTLYSDGDYICTILPKECKLSKKFVECLGYSRNMKLKITITRRKSK